jgi:uncharacterized protein (TIGR00730 family)
MPNKIKALCVYCGSASRLDPLYLEAARQVGQTAARLGMRIIYGAGSTGLMGALAEGALQTGGEVTGVIPSYFNTPVLAHSRLTTLEVVDTIHQRKARMVELADAFLALPGGFGTLDELFETLTWAQIGLHHKPIGILNVNGYFDPLLKMVEFARQEGFIYSQHRDLFNVAEQPAEILAMLSNHTPPEGLESWLTRPDDK